MTEAPGMRSACAFMLCWLLGGCTSPLAEARTCFDEARYPEAVSRYRELGPTLPELDRRELFEYALYRGLSHLALGDALPAERWLTLAKRLTEADASLATSEEAGRLLAARRSMGHMPGD